MKVSIVIPADITLPLTAQQSSFEIVMFIGPSVLPVSHTGPHGFAEWSNWRKPWRAVSFVSGRLATLAIAAV